jgi:hypothetical protein
MSTIQRGELRRVGLDRHRRRNRVAHRPQHVAPGGGACLSGHASISLWAHACRCIYLAVYTYTGIFTDNRAHLPQIFIVVFRTKQLGLAVALPEVYPCTRPFLRACAEEAVRACGLAGPRSARLMRPVPSGPSVCLFVFLLACSFVSLFGCVCLSDGLRLRAQALIVLSFFKPVVDLRRRAVGHEVDGAPFNTQARLVTASNG